MRAVAAAVVAALIAFVAPSAEARGLPHLTVHSTSFDTNGDGGSWAWSPHGKAIWADAPSKAARVFLSLDDGDLIWLHGARRGLYEVGDRGVPVVIKEGSSTTVLFLRKLNG